MSYNFYIKIKYLKRYKQTNNKVYLQKFKICRIPLS
jgi:hypothetical protein